MPASRPRFSIITPVYETPGDVLRLMLASVREQTFTDWEHCIVNDASPSPEVAEILDKAARSDERVRVLHREVNGGIVAASNDALAVAQGEFVVLLDHDDELDPRALARVDAAIAAKPHADYVYTDEDKIDLADHHWDVFEKPDWSPERFRTQMCTGHLSVLRRSLVEQVGGFDPAYEGSQDWDLVFKVTERARHVVHVPEVLYHWRALGTSTAATGDQAKPWAFEAGRGAIQAHCKRIGLAAEVDQDPSDPGIYHLRPALERTPWVSIVMPTGGHRREVWAKHVVLVTHCVRSIVESSTYPDYEIVCVADTSTPPPVLDELREIAGDRLRLVMFDEPFSFSAKINLGAIHSQGEHLLLLNDDMEVATPDWIERLVMYSDFDGVGAVGARLHYGDKRLQHAGVVFDDGLPGHLYRGFRGEFRGYFNAVLIAQNYLTVTGACLMTPRPLFEELGGLSPDLPINFNDVDYCLKVWDHGLRVVYDPDTVLYHFESSSREAHVEKWEIDKLIGRWAHMVKRDPFKPPLHVEPMSRLPLRELGGSAA